MHQQVKKTIASKNFSNQWAGNVISPEQGCEHLHDFINIHQLKLANIFQPNKNVDRSRTQHQTTSRPNFKAELLNTQKKKKSIQVWFFLSY
jgi:hypothetical protein